MVGNTNFRCAIFAAAALVADAGCTPEAHRYIRFPNLFRPGTAAQQRAAAVEHDPFPENNIGPEIVGGRPLGYQAGVPEADRMTMNAVPPPGVRPTVVPGAPIRPLVGPTYAPAPTYPMVPQMAPPVAAPAPVTAAPAFAAPPPVVTTPYPATPATPSAPFLQQQRSPY